MKIRFQADDDFNQSIISGLLRREPSIDFQTAEAGCLRGLNDSDVLAVAAVDGRALVSHDFKTMPDAYARFLQERNERHPGLLIVPQTMPILAAIDYLQMIWEASDASEWINRVCRLPL